MQKKLPAGMALLTVLQDVRTRTWDRLKDVMSRYVPILVSRPGYPHQIGWSKITVVNADYLRNLLTACEAIKWPLKVDYPSLGARERRDFERAFQDLLVLQAEYLRIPHTQLQYGS